ncbi:MAG: pyridoxamine 5'-phosphate oxidase [Tangfeifania sp.]
MDIHSLRKEYKFKVLNRKSVDKNPFKQFETWLNEAIKSEIMDPTAMTVSTIDENSFPQSRIVLLKYLDENGFVFFTNYKSQKGKSIENNPSVSLLFFWPELERQVRIDGFANKTSKTLSEKYFHSRPLESRIGAWASEQSSKIPNRKYLEKRFGSFKKKFGFAPPLPDFWGGFNVSPVKIEFWQGRENRLHDRILYEKTENEWKIKRLAP